MAADLEALAASPAHAAFLHRVVERAAAARSDVGVAGQLAAIEASVRRRASGGAGGSLRTELAHLEAAARIDLDVPTASRVPGASGVKLGVKKLVGFYLNHVGQQVVVMGQAMVRLGRSTASEVARLDEELRALRHEVDELAQAVQRAEGGEPTR